MQDQKAGILNAISKVATPKVAATITDHIIEVGIEKVNLDSIQALEGVSNQAANRVVGALELHTTLAQVKVRKQREKKPSQAQQYVADTTEEVRNDIAVQVAELRINAAGTRPEAWRSIREKLGLKLDQFHKVIRLSDGWKQAVADRINTLLKQEGGWTYNGKLEVLTGIDITLEEIKEMDVQEDELGVDLEGLVNGHPNPIDTQMVA